MKIIILALLLPAMALAQTITMATGKPLQCPKYQHEEFVPAHCANTCDLAGVSCTTECRYVAAEDKCVDDLHVLTEREWQELQARLKALEQAAQAKK